MKAWKVTYDFKSVIVFHENKSKAKLYVMKHEFYCWSDEALDSESYIELRVIRAPEFDEYCTEKPSGFSFCKNAKVYQSKGWDCDDSILCSNSECVFFNDIN